jgi:MoxR-like ATPase
MNIREAKQQIKNAMIAYFTKDEFGNYLLPPERQRPVFLLGAPGIGKTAIMEQIAQELEVGFVSYSMTHHTRQSALGLPFIATKTYDGVEYQVSEYTMSEIIASVYEAMEATGRREGILFLDEINCVSETLTPAMLQFLQYKIFGRHAVPDGWIVVTAGNPPEYTTSTSPRGIASSASRLSPTSMCGASSPYRPRCIPRSSPTWTSSGPTSTPLRPRPTARRS